MKFLAVCTIIGRIYGCWLAYKTKIYMLGMDFKNNQLKLLALQYPMGHSSPTAEDLKFLRKQNIKYSYQ